MADNHKVFPPNFRLTDSDGNVLASGTVEFYDAGTSDARTVYSNNGLTTAIGTTVTANASGEPTSDGGSTVSSVYTGTGDYKVIIKDSTGATVGTFDNQTGALDTSSFSNDTAVPTQAVITKSDDYTVQTTDQGKVIDCDASGGNFTITLPDATTAADAWLITVKNTGTSGVVTITGTGGDTIDGQTSILLTRRYSGVTIDSDGANWHILNNYPPTQTLVPQGRLTPTSGSPVISSSATGGGAVYWAPYNGDVLPIYDGTRFVPWEVSELTLTLNSADNLSDTAYDVFAFLDSQTVRIGTGPAWTNSAAGSGDRTASALTRVKGLLVNNAQITCSNNGTDYTVGANKGTYLGSVLMDNSAAEITCHVDVGQRRRWAIWNAYNRQDIHLKETDPTASWSYNTATKRASNNDSNNKIDIFLGLNEEAVDIEINQEVSLGAADAPSLGIGWNTTATESGFTTGVVAFDPNDLVATGRYLVRPGIGLNTANAVESGGGAAATTWYGGERNMLFVAKYRG